VEQMKKFMSGLLLGTLATAAAVAGLAASVKKTVIDPIDEKESMIEENRKKAMRKRVAR
jgi:predicted histidine transporter YuiF (NhaC family)